MDRLNIKVAARSPHKTRYANPRSDAAPTRSASFPPEGKDVVVSFDGQTAADFEQCSNPARRPGYTIGRMFSHLLVEGSQHLGQVAYLRGLQRGLEYPTA